MKTQIQTQTPVSNNQVIRLPEVIEMVGLKRASIYVMMKNGSFPLPIKIGMGTYANGWILAEVQSWINERIKARDQKAEG